jgi:tetratricopeptide (TPR) repeat protein
VGSIVGLLILACLASIGGPALAGEEVRYAPPPAWVKPLAVPNLESDVGAGAFQLLLQNDQAHYASEGDDFYSERAIRLRTPQALQSANIIQSWNPETESLTVHVLRIIRGRQVIDVLAGGKKMTVLRREKNLESASLDGALTATLQPEGLMVGDILDYAVTLRRKDPLRQGHSEGVFALAHEGVAGRVYIRQLWPDAKPIHWRATAGLPAPAVSRANGETELLIDVADLPSPKAPLGAPMRYLQLGQLQVSQYRDWAEVSALMAPLYRKASTLAEVSPVKVEAARIRAASTDPRQRAFAALKLVQDQVRYVFLGMNLGGYLPADADTTWSRRFGDCKGKTALLLALLHELGIEAEPAFVASVLGDGLDQKPPSLGVFDHVLIQAKIAGKTYWLDGTRSGDRNLEDIPTPAFHWALPIQASGAQLVAMVQTVPVVPDTERNVRFDIKAGLDAPAKVHIELIYRGDSAIASRIMLDQVAKTELDRRLREFWSQQYAWIQASTVGSSYDEQTGVMRLWLDGSGAMDWAVNGQVRDFEIEESNLGGTFDYQRETGPDQDAPFAVDFPAYARNSVAIELPENGAGFSLLNSEVVDTTVAGVAYSRKAGIRAGAVLVETEQRSVAPEFPAADAPTAGEALRKLGARDVFLRAFAPSSTVPDDAPTQVEPTDAAGLAAKAIGELSRGDYRKAIDDFTRVITSDPKSSKYIYDRGTAYFQIGDDVHAMADFNQALRLAPDDGLTLMARAELNLLHDDQVSARRDFDQALKAAPNNADYQRRRADAYQDAGLWDVSVGYYADWLKRFAANPSADAMRGRLCLAKAKLGRDLGSVLEECDAVLKARPELVAGLEGRGLALLRIRRYMDAAATYDHLTRIDSKVAAGLYGRGVARSHAGLKAQGEADMKAGLAIDPGIAADFKRYGLAP